MAKIFCGQNLLDTQDRPSYTQPHKKEVLINQFKLSAAALQVLIGYNWPGNIRELKNIIERASIMSEDGEIGVQHLPENIRQEGKEKVFNSLKDDLPLDEKINLMEKEMIISALKESGGVQVKAAQILGINQRSLWHRIKKHEIEVRTIKNLH